MNHSHLIGQENRLVRYLASDFGYKSVTDAKKDARSLSLQTQQQQQTNLDAQRTQQQQVTDLNAFEADRMAYADQNQVAYTPTNYSRTAGTADVGTGISGTKLDANGNPVVVYNDSSKVTMDRSLPTSTRQSTSGLQFGSQLEGALDGFNAPTLSGNASAIEGDIRKRYSAMGISDPAIIDDAITKAIQADNARMESESIKSNQAKSQMTDSANSNAAANEMQQSTSKIPGSMEIALAGLPPEDAAAIRAALEASLGAGDKAESAAISNYNTDVKAADASMGAYDKVLDGMKADATLMNNATQGFIDDMQERREKSAAEAKTNALNQIKSEEMRQDRKMKADNDKHINSLILGQAIGGGFGSSNWIAEVSQAEWDGEQAINDMHEDFGFKAVDVEIAYKDTLDGIYEWAGSSKLDALKSYKSELQNIGNLRFSATDKTEDRKATAKKTLNNTFAEIAKTQAADIKAAAEDVRTTRKEMKAEKADRESNAWSRLMDIKTTFGSNAPRSLIESVAKDLPGIDVNQVLSAKTWAELKEEADNNKDATYDGLISSYSTQNGGTVDITLVADRVARAYGKTADERAEYKRQIAEALASGQTVEQLLPRLETDFWLSQSGPPKVSHDSRQQTLAGITNIEGYLKQYGLSSDGDGSLGPVSSRFQGLLSVAGLSSTEYNAISAAVGSLRAEIIKDRYGSAVTPQELAIAESFIPDMKLKGPKFMENLQNLKAYTDFLDKKYFNQSVGLALPQDPASARFESQNGTSIPTEDMTHVMTGGASSRPTPGPSAMRTDRHNNPTAFTTDIAKQAGLVEGVDYVFDPALANGFPTAKILGDPVATTIKVIDNIGFYTQGGKQRWTHTAMTKSQWNTLSYAEKKDTIRKMYQREGGSELTYLFS